MPKKKTRKEIGWLCFECGYKGGTYGINLTCGKCQSKYDNLELSSGSYAQCEKCIPYQRIRLPVCECGTKMLPFDGTFEELKKMRRR